MPDAVHRPDPATPPAKAEAPSARRPRRWLRWTVGAGVVLCGLVASAPFLVSTSWMNDRVRGWLESNVDREVAFESLDLSWTRGVLIRGLVVHDDRPGRPPVLEAPRVELRAPLLPMLLRRFDVQELVIDDAVVRVSADGDRSRRRGFMKMRKGRRRRPADTGDEEPLVLPDIDVPVSVGNLTVVFADGKGREARRGGIEFKGYLSTRDGPSDFRLDVPVGDGGSVRLQGTATLFDDDGAVLAMDEVRIKADLDVTGVDAQKNADLLAVFLPGRVVAGVVEAHVHAESEGSSAKGSIDLRVRGVAVDDAVGKRSSGTDDLIVTARFELAGKAIKVEGLDIRADGLAVTANVAGTWPQLDGRVDLDADLGRMTAALRVFGVDADTSLAGTAKGDVTFAGTSEARGSVALTGLRVTSHAAKHPPVAVDRASVTFAGKPQGDAFALDRCDVQLADLTAHAEGTIAKDGALDLRTSAKGDLGGLLVRARDLGFLPSGFSLNGTLDAAADVKGRAGGTGADALGATIRRLVLAEDDARIELKGTASAASVDLTASGEGDLGKLLGRAQAAGVKGPGLDAVSGRFAFDASAKGPPDALVVSVPRFKLDGAFAVDASGEMRADGAVAAKFHAEGRTDDAVALARKLGFLDRDLKVGGTLVADADASGTRAEIVVPKFAVALTGGLVTADVRGSLAAGGKVDGTVTADAALADVCTLALSAGWLEKPLTPAGRVTLRGGFSGTRDAVVVPSAEVRVTELVDLQGTASMDASGVVKADAAFSGALQPLLDVAAQWTGGAARRLDGTLSGTLSAAGPRSRVAVRLPKLSVAAGGVTVNANAARDADGAAKLTATARGAVADLLAVLRAFDIAPDVKASGDLDATFDAALDGSRVTGAATGIVKSFVLEEPLVGGEPFRETHLGFNAAGLAYDLDTRKLEPLKLELECEGASIDAMLAMEETVPTPPKTATPTTPPAAPARVVRIDGRLRFEEAFARNHADLLSGVRFTSLHGPFKFAGDVSDGRAAAKGWTGGGELDVTGLVAPYVKADKAHVTAKLADGVLVLDPVEGTVNGGLVTGSARIGLAGAAPEHSADLVGKDVAIGGDLAPLVAHASPLFAVGEKGTTGGRAGIDVHLTARGTDAAAIKRTLAGKGSLALTDAYVESGGWIGTLLSFVGQGGRMDIAPVAVPFEVGGGKVRTGDVAMDGVGLLLRLGGSVGLDGKLDYGLRLKPKSESSSAFSKFRSVLDSEGFLPLRLEGKLSKPKLRAPDIKDALLDKLGDLLRGDEKDEDEPPPPEPAGKKGGGKKKPAGDKPVPPDKPSEPPPPEDEPPPPLPPRGR